MIEAADGGRTGSLLHEIDRTCTPMGGRLIRAWLLRPLVTLERIQDRLDAVEDFAFRGTERAKVRETLKTVHDIERLVARAALGTAGPRDLVALRQSLAAVPRVRMLLERLPGAARCAASWPSSTTWRTLRDELDRTLLDEPPAVARDGGAIRDGVDPELDDLRTISRSGKQRIAEMEEAERAPHRHQLAQDPLQPRVRLLHRDLQVEPRQRAGRLSPQADDRRRRALHHARR